MELAASKAGGTSVDAVRARGVVRRRDMDARKWKRRVVAGGGCMIVGIYYKYLWGGGWEEGEGVDLR